VQKIENNLKFTWPQYICLQKEIALQNAL